MSAEQAAASWQTIISEQLAKELEKELRAELPFARRGGFGELVRSVCLDTDPHRGVPCHLPFGHSGDHQSQGGFPWENVRDPRPKYQGATEEDMAALEELLPGILEDAAAPDVTYRSGPNLILPCDDCGAKAGELCDGNVEH